LCLFR